MAKSRHYWLVGANWSGDDQADAFYRRGYWELGYDDAEQPGMARKRDSIRVGDRIAIKAMRGRGATTITIKGLGVVKEASSTSDKRIYIVWLVPDLKRQVAAKGCFKAIHGPYSPRGKDASWVREVFCI